MPDNIHPINGLPFGVLSGGSSPELLNHIQDTGRDGRYDNWVATLRHDLWNALAEIEATSPEDVRRVLQRLGGPEAEVGMEYVAHDGSFDIGEVVDAVVASAVEHYEGDGLAGFFLREGEQLYSVTSDYEIVIEDSEWATYCRRCSPCFPNAGDLSACTPADDGCLALCPPPTEWSGWVTCINLRTNEIVHA